MIRSDQANIMFDEYHLIDYGVQKEEAQKLIQNASVIFLLVGNVVEQNGLLMEYELSDLIKKSRAVMMGTSAGAINMSAKWLCSKYTGYKGEISSINKTYSRHIIISIKYKETTLFRKVM